MAWLIKNSEDKFEVWSDEKYTSMQQKCDYYGARPSWQVVRRLSFEHRHANAARVIQYQGARQSEKFALVIDFLRIDGQRIAKAIDLDSLTPVFLPLPVS